jgi:MFS family permease
VWVAAPETGSAARSVLEARVSDPQVKLLSHGDTVSRQFSWLVPDGRTVGRNRAQSRQMRKRFQPIRNRVGEPLWLRTHREEDARARRPSEAKGATMDRRTIAIIAALGIPTLTIGTDFTGALMLIIPIEHEFSADVTTTQWVLNIYALTFAMGMVTAGRFADMLGRRRVLMIGVAVFVLGSVGCAVAPSMGLLIAARAAQGIGAAIMWPCLLGIASTSVREDERATALGFLMGAITLGNVIGPIVAGVVGGLGDWRLFYVVNLVLGIASAVIIPLAIPREAHTARNEPIDYAGIVVLSLAILGLLYALDVGADWGWTSWPIVGLFVVAAALFAAFPAIEAKVAGPLVPPPMLRNRQFLLALSTNALCVPAVFLLFLYVPQYLHKVQGWSVLMASIGTLPLMGCLFAGSMGGGRFYNRVGPRRLLSFGYAVTSLGAVATILVAPAWGYSGLLPAMVLVGIGASVAIGAAGTAAVGAADPSRASLAGGLSFMAHLGMGAVGVAMGTAILFGVSAAKLQQGLAALGISLSTADQITLSGAAAGTEASRAILDRFSSAVAEQVTAVLRDAFVSGLHRAYWFALLLAVIGIAVSLSLDDQKLKKVDQ